MSRQFPDNRQCCRETIVPTPPLSLSLSFSFFLLYLLMVVHFALPQVWFRPRSWSPLFFCPGAVEIQFQHQSVEPAINKDQLIPTGLFSFSFSFCPSIKRFQFSSSSFHSKNYNREYLQPERTPKTNKQTKNPSHFNSNVFD